MAIVMTYDNSYISSPSGYNYFAEAAFGGNGDPFGYTEISAGTPNDSSGEHYTWDTDPDDGINPGYVPIDLTFQQGSSGLTLSADQGEATTEWCVSSFTRISHVDISAAVQYQTGIYWKNASVKFYNNGVLSETVSLGSFGVDKTSVPGGGVEEIIKSITPQSTANKVVISGGMMLSAPEGIYPGPTDMFSDVRIYTV